MPTQSTTYNTRLTDETLEKRFRDTFTSQGGAELVDDLYASGVIVPVVDFTAAAEGSALRSDLQSAWDYATTHVNLTGVGSTNIIATPGFWKFILIISDSTGNSALRLSISDGLSTKVILAADRHSTSTADLGRQFEGVVFLRTGDTLLMSSDSGAADMNCSVRQLASLSGDLTQPSGFQSS